MMKKVGIKLSDKINLELDKDFDEAMKDENFSYLIKLNNITKEVGRKYTSKLMDSANELKECKGCKNIMNCPHKIKGHVLYPKCDENIINFTYIPCKREKELEKKQIEKERLLDSVGSARMKDIDIKDGNRVGIIKWLKNFYDNYEEVNTLKGLYLHGNFGSGKTYLIAALLNELKESKNAQIEIVYFPELLRNMKENFNTVEGKLTYLQNVDILLLDDIGAENVTSWGRDEILGTILQSRMNHKLTTFFTSNLNMVELEKHLSMTKNSEDLVKARRIIERIKQLTDDMELVSINRRK